MLAYVGCWLYVGPMLAYLGPMLAYFGPMWVHLGAYVGPVWAHLGAHVAAMFALFLAIYVKTTSRCQFFLPEPPPGPQNHVKTKVLNIAKIKSVAAEGPQKHRKNYILFFEHHAQKTL